MSSYLPRNGPLWRAIYTLQYHQPMQLLRRLHTTTLGKSLRSSGQPRLGNQFEVDSSKRETFRQLFFFRTAARRPSIRNPVDDILKGSLTFLGATAELSWPFRWHDVQSFNVDHLWRFHLHYHEFLLDLASRASPESVLDGRHDYSGIPSSTTPASGSDDLTEPARDRTSSMDAKQCREAIWTIVSNWVDAFPRPSAVNLDDAWHPFCISRRLPVWMMVWHEVSPSEVDREKIAVSLAEQAEFLAENLELDPGGNHLLENLRGLILAGVFLKCQQSEKWLNLAEGLLRRELPLQVLPHGEHFERAPTYHSIVLELLLDIRDCVSGTRPKLAEFTGEHARKMVGFLQQLRHPDGEIPLFSDSVFAAAPVARVVLDRAGMHMGKPGQHEGTQAFGGYWTWRTQSGDALLFDAGPAAADNLPAHAHCDLLNLEASVGGKRLFVDGGVYDYGDTEMRRICRGTSAHNVMQVDDVDQFDVWSRFRMGYRGHPTQLQHGETNGFHWAQSTHNAYRRIGIPTVGRWVGCRESGPWLCIDWVLGHGDHRFTNRLRIHPDFEVTEKGATNEYVLSSGQQTVHLKWLGQSDEISIENGWYCPEFGTRHQIPVLTWTANSRPPVYSAWMVYWPNREQDIELAVNGSCARVTYASTGDFAEISFATSTQ